MKELAHYIKKNYQKPENGLMKIIMTYTIIYAVFTIVKIFLDTTLYNGLLQHLALSNTFSDNCWQPWCFLLYTCLVPGQYGSIWYFMFCLYWLYTFGERLVRLLNNTHLVRLYLLSTLFCAFFFLLITYYVLPLLREDIGPFTLAGPFMPICAIISAVATLSPNYPYHLFFFHIKLKHFIYLLLAFFFLQLTHQETPPKEVSRYLTSIGALLFGYLYIQYQQGNLTMEAISRQGFLKKFFGESKQVKNQKKIIKKTGKEEIDAILDKISRYGYRSLTEEEKKKLFEV